MKIEKPGVGQPLLGPANNHSPPHVTCMVSHARCHVSYVASGGPSLWKVYFQQGLPCLVSNIVLRFFSYFNHFYLLNLFVGGGANIFEL